MSLSKMEYFLVLVGILQKFHIRLPDSFRSGKIPEELPRHSFIIAPGDFGIDFERRLIN